MIMQTRVRYCKFNGFWKEQKCDVAHRKGECESTQTMQMFNASYVSVALLIVSCKKIFQNYIQVTTVFLGK